MKEMYANEVRFYRDVQPFVPIHSPRCYYAGSDPSSHQSIVIMEDLNAKGVEFLHAQCPQGYAQRGTTPHRHGPLSRTHVELTGIPRWRSFRLDRQPLLRLESRVSEPLLRT